MTQRTSAPIFTFISRPVRDAMKAHCHSNGISQSELIEFAIIRVVQPQVAQPEQPTLKQRQDRVKEVSPMRGDVTTPVSSRVTFKPKRPRPPTLAG